MDVRDAIKARRTHKQYGSQPVDEETLRAIADLTRGDYFYAGNAVDLKKIYQTMNSRLVMETKKTEIGAFFSAAAALLVLVAGLLSLAWFNRIL